MYNICSTGLAFLCCDEKSLSPEKSIVIIINMSIIVISNISLIIVITNAFTMGAVTSMYSDTINYTFSSPELFVAPLSTDYTSAYMAGSFVLRSEFGWVQDLGLNALQVVTTPIRFTNDTKYVLLV